MSYPLAGSRRIALGFALGVAVVIAALAWTSTRVLSLESREHEARRQATSLERIRLALWRLDAAVTPIVARESARPYFQYQPFYAADRAYTSMLRPIVEGEVLIPSPLLSGGDPPARLHFQREGDVISSPQVPDGLMRELGEGVYLTPYAIEESTLRLRELRAILLRGLGTESSEGAASMRQRLEEPVTIQQREIAQAAVSDYANRVRVNEEARRGVQAFEQNLAKAAGQSVPMLSASGSSSPADATGSDAPLSVIVGPFEPRWVASFEENREPEMLFVRRVQVGDASFEQGVWIDWPRLRDDMLAQIRDILPEARLLPAPEDSRPDDVLRLASLPVILDPGPLPVSAAGPGLSPMAATMIVLWGAAALAIISVAVALRASLELAERRGRFVSAVTHELRTPLTSFCLYTQMLADGMVKDPDQQRQYVATLRDESRRLAGIVESVLDYARLGRTRSLPLARVGALEVVSACLPAARRRCEECAVQLAERVELSPRSVIRTDIGSVERIVANLIDNACKYGSGKARRVEFSASPSGRWLEIRVRDFGPGIPRDDSRRIFRPFARGKAQSAGTTPGMGLGLALSQGLARELKGELRHQTPEGGGAEFVLRLPLEPAETPARFTDPRA